MFSTRQKLAGVTHGIIILLAYTSPTWLDWKLIVAGVLIYYLRIWIFGGCLLTKAQFGRFDASFTGHYLKKLLNNFGFKPADRKIKLFLDLLASIFIIIAMVSQLIFHFKPLVIF